MKAWAKTMNPCLRDAYILVTGVLGQRNDLIWFNLTKVLRAARGTSPAEGRGLWQGDQRGVTTTIGPKRVALGTE